MATTIVTKSGSGAPTASDLVAGELAVDLTNKRLYTEDSSAAIIELGTNPSGNVTFGDNGKAIFGAGSDLQIYHDGSNSYVKDNGVGDLIIQAYDDIKFQQSTDNADLVTINTGGNVTIHGGNLDVTGSVTADKLITDSGVDAASFTSTGSTYVDINNGTVTGRLQTISSDFFIGTATVGTSLAFKSGNGVEAVRIDSSQNVGIGTSSTGFNGQGLPLVVGSGTGSTGMTIFSGADSYGTLQFADAVTTGAASYAGVVSYNHTNNFMYFSTASTERMRIDSSGNLLVGTTSQPSSFKMFVDSGANSSVGIRGSSTTYNAMVFYTPASATAGFIQVSGSTTSYNTSSDYRLKENVVGMSGATERLKQLKPSRFNFIADADTTVDGFLAHEVQDIVPEAITGTKDAVDADGNPEYQGIDQSKLVPLLVATIQELEARIAALES